MSPDPSYFVAVCNAAPAASHSSSACASAAALLGARLGEGRGLRRIAREQAAVGERRIELLDFRVSRPISASACTTR